MVADQGAYAVDGRMAGHVFLTGETPFSTGGQPHLPACGRQRQHPGAGRGGAGGSMEESYAREGSRFRSQIFLTNLVSSTTGLRTLNIDLGVEGEVNHHDELRPLVAATGLSGAGRRGPSLMTGALDFRIFGKHIQDSSLILKGGRWEGNNPWLADADRRKDYPIGGLMAGAELSLYLFRTHAHTLFPLSP